MIWLLQQILCAIAQLAAAIVGLLVDVLNATIVGLGALLEFLIGLLPNMPPPVDPPDSGVLGLVNWLIPIAPMVAFCATALLLWVGFMASKVLLNWLRAL